MSTTYKELKRRQKKCTKCKLKNVDEIFLTPIGEIPRFIQDDPCCYPFKGETILLQLECIGGEPKDLIYYESTLKETKGMIMQYELNYYHMAMFPCWGACIQDNLDRWNGGRGFPYLSVEDARIWLEDLKNKRVGRFKWDGIDEEKRQYIPARKKRE